MGDDFKILPGQVTQLTGGNGPETRPWRSGRWANAGTPEQAARMAGPRVEIPADALDWMTPRGPCQECGERPATVLWSTDGTMGLIHGGYRYWCNRCALRAQVEHARDCAARLPELERQLAEEER